jgi:Protein of unknown function (DUF4240)
MTDEFWRHLEEAWEKTHPELTAAREGLARGEGGDEAAAVIEEAADDVVTALRESLGALPKDALLEFDRTLERSLFRIDRAEIQEHTDGSDDGFLYARGFIVLVGKAYFDAVDRKPEMAMMDVECEELAYLSWHIHKEKFGEVPASGISRESCSNAAGWPE